MIVRSASRELAFLLPLNTLQTFHSFVPNFLQIYADYLIHVGYNPYRSECEVAYVRFDNNRLALQKVILSVRMMIDLRKERIVCFDLNIVLTFFGG
jgi:hypothetical protein